MVLLFCSKGTCSRLGAAQSCNTPVSRPFSTDPKNLGSTARPRFEERQLKGILSIFCRGMFGNSRSGASGFGFGVLKKEVNYRQEEKKILDSVLGPEVYDKRIRPSGLNSTGKPPRLYALFP